MPASRTHTHKRTELPDEMPVEDGRTQPDGPSKGAVTGVVARPPLTLLFESADVRLVHQAGDRSGSVVITFSSLNIHDHPFGDVFFAKHGVQAYHFVATWNHWWQPASVREAVAALVRVLAEAGHSRIVTYGSSMGAYGAAMYAGAFGAQAVLMLAPQWSADPARAPHEKRWAAEAKEISFLNDDMRANISTVARKYLVYDPASEDRAHATLYGRVPNTFLMPCPDGGHAIGHTLQQSDLLTGLVMEVLDGEIDLARWRDRWVQARRRSGRFWYELGKRAMRLRRPALGLSCLSRAVELRPQEAAFQIDVGYALIKHQRFEEAIKAFEAASDLVPDHPAPWRGMSMARRHLRQPQAAVTAAREALSRRPRSTDLLRVLTSALIEAEQFGQAADTIMAALDMEPNYQENRRLLELAVTRLRAKLAHHGMKPLG